MIFFFQTTLFQNKLLDTANPSSILINEKSYSLATDLNIQPSFFGTDTHAATLMDVNGNKQAFHMYCALMAPVERVSSEFILRASRHESYTIFMISHAIICSFVVVVYRPYVVA